MLNELDPQVKTLLEQFQANAAQHPASPLSAKEKIIATRQMMTGAYAALRYPSESVSRTEDFAIPSPGGKIPVRLYVPHTIILSGGRGIRQDLRPIAAPVLVYYHGGGFVAGDLESQDSLLRALANRSQCIVISVAYRLAPENPYPAGNDDAWAALTWVADHVSEIGADLQRLAVGGDSAGGLLAAWVAQKAAKNGPRLRLQVLLYPNLDATTSRPSWKELGTGAYLVSHAQMIEWYDAYLPQEINRKAPEVSPLLATDLSGVAPAFIITADHDPLHDEGDEYAAKLKAANVAVDHTCWPGMVHGLASLAGVLDAGKVLIDQTGAALRKAFKPSNVPLDIPGLLDTLAPNGRLHVVGAILEPMQVPAFGLILGQRSISGSPTGSPTAISTMLEFSARHSVAPITETFPMSKVNDALEHLRSGKARYRIVLVNDHAQSA